MVSKSKFEEFMVEKSGVVTSGVEKFGVEMSCNRDALGEIFSVYFHNENHIKTDDLFTTWFHEKQNLFRGCTYFFKRKSFYL